MRTIINKKSSCGIFAGILRSALGLFLLVFAAGCSKDDKIGGDFVPADPEEVYFGAFVGGGDNATRANTSIYNVTTEFYGNCDFYMTVKEESASGEVKIKSSVYEIPSGSEAVISPKTTVVDGETHREETLNWFSREKAHTFWGWAAHRDFYTTGTNSLLDDGNVEIEFKGSTLDETTDNTANYWKSTPDETTVWKNGEVLEQLIGAQKGPLVYNDNGMYVPLQFRHLVSKIFLSYLYLVDNSSGTTDSNVKGLITFYGMPKKATLYTNPTKKNDEGEDVAISPYVAMDENWDYKQTEGVTYAITNNRSGSSSSNDYRKQYKWEGNSYTSVYARDCWYICPEVDFDRISYKIEVYEYSNGSWVPSSKYGKHGAYYGDFKNVTFSRTTNGSNYDDPNGGDTKILHAGEYMTLTIYMTSKGNPSVKGSISDWSNASRTGSSHVHQGIYGIEELKDMSTTMGSTSNTEEQKRKRDEFYEMLGSGRTTEDDDKSEYPQYKDKNGDDTELKIFELYDDIGEDSYYSYSSSSTTVQNQRMGSISPGDGYILDGKGHTINCYSNNSMWAGYNNPLVSIGPGTVRDVYLRYYYYNNYNTPYGYHEYIVYIDKMGNIWLVDPVTFEMTPTENNINESGKSPMNINLKTGAIS